MIHTIRLVVDLWSLAYLKLPHNWGVRVVKGGLSYYHRTRTWMGMNLGKTKKLISFPRYTRLVCDRPLAFIQEAAVMQLIYVDATLSKKLKHY